MAWSILLAHYTASPEVVFGVTNMGRRSPVPGIDRMVGPTVATLPFRVKLDLSASIEASLEQVQAQDTAMTTFEHIGITRIRSFSADARKGTNFQTLLLIQPKSKSGDDRSGQELFVRSSSEDYSANCLNAFNSYALMLVCQIRSHGFQLHVSYDVNVISTEEVNHICKQLEHVVRHICTENIRKIMIKDINVTPTMRLKWLRNWNQRRHHDGGESALSDDLTVRGSPHAERVSPTTEIEVQMQQLWASLPAVDASSFAVSDSFLLLGGNSIQAMRLIGLARDQGLSLKVSDVFNTSCLGDLAKVITKEVIPHNDPLPFALLSAGESLRSVLNAAPLQDMELMKENVADILPATEFQTECISSALTEPLGRRYHFFMDLPQGTSIKHVEDTCIKLWNHLDILRTVFIRAQDRDWQIVLRNLPPDISIHRTEKNLEQFSFQTYQDDFNRSLSLGKSFVRFLIMHAANEHVRLAMRFSHAQYDGVSLGLIQSCFAAYFNGITPPPNPKFGAFIQHIQRQQDSGRKYWHDLLAGSAITHILPTRNATQSSGTVLVSGDNIRVQKMINTPKHRSGATQAALFIACCACALARKNESSDVVFGLVDSGRSGLLASLQNVVGPCNSTIPVRVRFDDEIAIDHALANVRAQHIQGSPYQTHQFSDIVHYCTDWPEDTKEFGVSIQFQNVEEQPTASLAGVESRLEVYARQESARTKEVFIFTQPMQDSWAIDIQACASYHCRNTIVDFVEELMEVASGLW